MRLWVHVYKNRRISNRVASYTDATLVVTANPIERGGEVSEGVALGGRILVRMLELGQSEVERRLMAV
jgi:hypothetical protein